MCETYGLAEAWQISADCLAEDEDNGRAKVPYTRVPVIDMAHL